VLTQEAHHQLRFPVAFDATAFKRCASFVSTSYVPAHALPVFQASDLSRTKKIGEKDGFRSATIYDLLTITGYDIISD